MKRNDEEVDVLDRVMYKTLTNAVAMLYSLVTILTNKGIVDSEELVKLAREEAGRINYVASQHDCDTRTASATNVN